MRFATPIQAIRVEEDLTQKVTKRYVFVARGSKLKFWKMKPIS